MGLDVSWHNERAYKTTTADIIIHNAASTYDDAAAAAASTAAVASSITVDAPTSTNITKIGWNVEKREERGQEGKAEGGGGEEEAGRSCHDSANTGLTLSKTTTRGSITVLNMSAAWIKTGKDGTARLEMNSVSVEKGTEKMTEEEGGVEKGKRMRSILGVTKEIEGVDSTRGLDSSGLAPGLAPVLGATVLNLAPVRVLELKELNVNNVTDDTSLV